MKPTVLTLVDNDNKILGEQYLFLDDTFEVLKMVDYYLGNGIFINSEYIT